MTRLKTRFWRNAVPALVTRVSVGLTADQTLLELVLPNRLALGFGFKATQPYLELQGVKLQDIRPYTGTDHMGLRQALCKAIRAKRASLAVPDDLPATQDDDQQAEDSGSAPEQAVTWLCGEVAEDQPGQTEGVADVEVPQTPVLTRVLAKQGSGEKEPAKVIAVACVAEKLPPGGTPEVPGVAAEAPTPSPPKAASAADARRRFEAFTAAISRAFRAAGGADEPLTRRELALAAGAEFGESEFHEGVRQLEKVNKVFVSGDLVFCIPF